MTAANQHLRGIILAGGEGRRLQPFIRARFETNRPKQYCTFIGTSSMLCQTIARAEQVIPPTRLLTVVTRAHLPFAREELHDRPSDTVIIQPSNRETGPGILRALGSSQAADVVEEVYAKLPLVNFSHAILARSPHLLAVLPVIGVYWSDWGNPEQVRLDLARL
ncbi:MAG: NTP transferase domain-containing protein [Nitrospinae bacterium]|nr:NTP transferase domain-containing protein [Nitrospinota bacterium]